MLARLASFSVIAGLSLGIVACQKVQVGPSAGLETMPGIPPDGRIVSVTRGDGEVHGVWMEAPDGTLSMVWVNAATGVVYANPLKFARR